MSRFQCLESQNAFSLHRVLFPTGDLNLCKTSAFLEVSGKSTLQHYSFYTEDIMIICPFMLDQYYWAERMGWIGVSPPPLKRKHLIPDNDTDSILEAVSALLDAIHVALSGEIIARAADLAERICSEINTLIVPKFFRMEEDCNA
eukprot:Gb_26820 [translate_table: standard]